MPYSSFIPEPGTHKPHQAFRKLPTLPDVISDGSVDSPLGAGASQCLLQLPRNASLLDNIALTLAYMALLLLPDVSPDGRKRDVPESL